MKCKILGDITNRECKECHESQVIDIEVANSLGVNFYPQRAACAKENAEYLGEAFIAMKDDEMKSESEEFLEAFIAEKLDEDVCFELDGEIWVDVIGMKKKKYMTALNEFVIQLKRDKFEEVHGKEQEAIGLVGKWFRRRIKR